LNGEAYYWWRDNHRLCGYWFILQGLLRTRYAPPVHSSELDCRESNIEQEPGPEIQPIIDSFTVKVEADPERSVIIEADVLDEPESEVAAELVLLHEETPFWPTEVEAPLIEVSVDLPAEPTMEVSSQ